MLGAKVYPYVYCTQSEGLYTTQARHAPGTKNEGKEAWVY